MESIREGRRTCSAQLRHVRILAIHHRASSSNQQPNRYLHDRAHPSTYVRSTWLISNRHCRLACRAGQSRFVHKQLGLGVDVARAACLKAPRPQTFGCTTSYIFEVWVCVSDLYLNTGMPVQRSKLTKQGGLPTLFQLQFGLLHHRQSTTTKAQVPSDANSQQSCQIILACLN
jgi:hypothetical protein